MRDLRSAKVLVLGALAMVLLLTTNFSTAAFTSSSTSTGTVRAAADWTPPQAQLLSPFAPARGVALLTASATDGESSIATLAVERTPEGAGAWSAVCTRPSASYQCSWDTTTVPDGRYDVRATATDAAGYTGSSTPASVTVDNTAPTVRLLDPGSPLSGTRTFATADVADATSGVVRVEVQRAPRGTATWTTVCTTTAAPWSCSADTTVITDGSYDLRAVATDAAGNPGTSAVVTERVVANSAPVAPGPLNGADVQATNGRARAGWLETGDSITFTFAGAVRAVDVLPGWSGEQTEVTLRVRDGKHVGRGDAEDALDVLAGGTVIGGLGSVNLQANLYQNNQTATFNATMQMGTVTVGGVVRTTVTVTLGDPLSVNANHLYEGAPAHMAWTDATGGTVTESGVLDRDF